MEPPLIASGERQKARDLIAAIRTLKSIEHDGRLATAEERNVLARFPGFGSVALSIFPNPVTGQYKDGWRETGEELKSLLTAEEYGSARKTVFNAFYTSPVVIDAMHSALARLGVPADALALEPGCGTGNFLARAAHEMRFVGIELDGISGRIAKARFPNQDIRVEDFQNSRLPTLDAVIGNVPFADVKLDYHGDRLALHDYFIHKSLDALAPGGVMAIVSTHFSLDRQNAASREMIAEKADFIGAIRLPSDAFRREGTAVVTDVLCFRKRAPGEPAHHVDPDWLRTATKVIDGREVSVNKFFLNHPEQVLGDWSIQDTLYGATGYSLKSNGDLAQQLAGAVERLPRFDTRPSVATEPVSTFTPPPIDQFITEGSFFVADGKICRLEDGQAVPVVYGGSVLTPTSGIVGRRLAAQIKMKILARRVLQSQNDGWPEEHRVEARRELNRAYDAFVSAYGPINKTTFSETKDGTVIRRMPNVALWKQDPDGMLLLALESYDDLTGVATKAAILKRDVVGKAQPVTSVTSAEDGLVISLDQHGKVDLPFIAQLYGKSEATIIQELGDLIYLNPESKEWETADSYLSGNVRAKLKAADAAGPEFTRNAEALSGVQPDDVLPGEIDAGLGAPWIPVDDIRQFANELFRVSGIKVAHLEKDALWSVEGDWEAQQSVANTSEFGTSRINGLTLLDQALNMKSPIIYDTIRRSDGEERVVNQEETLAAKEKQRQIKEAFKAWIFNDPDRTERLVRLYNDTYNCLRPRLFDGSHLQFPGMSAGITLRQHQLDGIWRVMSGGNTLLGHVVGAGKTMLMIGAAMKMKQAGLVNKPMFCVPNHMLEQFGREFLQLYPNAKLLIAGKDDFTKERRKFLTAKIASGDFDGIIVTHSSFERVGMSKEYQRQFLEEQIADYDRLLVEHAANKSDKAQRNILKNLEKQKAAREQKLKDLLAEDKKDDGLVFDELGVDHLFIDEAHYFKNLELATKMERVAGIQTTGSERAFDLFMKARYLDHKHPGHGVTFATGTPVSNSMVELYTMQRYLDPKGLRDRGIEHFDAWAANFGEVVEAMEIAPDGKSLRPRSRFAKFVNLQELQQMWRAFSDIQTAEMLDLPRPALKGGKPETVACPMSPEQKALQDELVERYEKLRSQKVDPRVDNALNVTTDGRKLALDARMLSATAPDYPGSKINALADNVARIWRESANNRGTQLVFCDMGVNHTDWGFSVYETVKAKLIERGIPAGDIADIGDADSDAKKQALFERVRNGGVRVLLGSTAKLGTGTNVQKRLVALHHLDAPWKPAEIEQREGRILRQGNLNPEVSIYRYVTAGSFDAYMWQTLETKAKFIGQVMTGESSIRRAEDVSGNELSYAEVKAIASGNPAVLTLAEADAELQRLAILRKNHNDEQFLARKNLRDLPERIANHERWIANLTADSATLAGNRDVVIGNQRCTHEQVMARLTDALNRIPSNPMQTRIFPLGIYHGIPFSIERQPSGFASVIMQGKAPRSDSLLRDSQGSRAVMNAVHRLAQSYDEAIARHTKDKTIAEHQLTDYQARHGIPFAHGDYDDRLKACRDQLRTALSDTTEGAADRSESLAAQTKALMAERKVEAATLPPKRLTRAETPVTARLRRPVPPVDVPAIVIAPVPPVAANDMIVPSCDETLDDPADSPSFRDRLAQDLRPARQLSLF